MTENQCQMPGMGWGRCELPECRNPKRTRSITEWVYSTNETTNEGSN